MLTYIFFGKKDISLKLHRPTMQVESKAIINAEPDERGG